MISLLLIHFSVDPCAMPFDEGVSSHILTNTFKMHRLGILDYKGNPASQQACLKYLEEIKKQCSSRNATFNQQECEKSCSKLILSQL